MRNLPDLVQAVLNDLYICSNSAVYKQLNNEADIYLVLGAMFNLLTICSEYS